MPAEIVQIIQEFSTVGGAENVAWELSQAFGRLGLSNIVLTSRPDAPHSHPTRIHRIARYLSGIPTRGWLRHLGRFLVVPIFSVAATLAMKNYRQSVAISHGDSLFGDILVVHAVNAENLLEKQRAGEWVWRLNPLHLWVHVRDNRMIRGLRYRKYVAVSPRVAQELNRHYDVPYERIRVISNGIDTGRFKPDETAGVRTRERFGIPPKAKLLLFVGHEFERKGLAHVIDAMERLGDEHWLLVVGAGNEARYRKMSPEVQPRIVFAGEQHNLQNIYPSADAFVFPTAYETFSMVCMEAMACGIPVFATRAGGIEDYLKDEFNGYAIEMDGADIAAKLEKAFADPDRMAAMKQGARETSLAYRWDAIAEQYVSLVEEISAEKGETSAMKQSESKADKILSI